MVPQTRRETKLREGNHCDPGLARGLSPPRKRPKGSLGVQQKARKVLKKVHSTKQKTPSQKEVHPTKQKIASFQAIIPIYEPNDAENNKNGTAKVKKQPKRSWGVQHANKVLKVQSTRKNSLTESSSNTKQPKNPTTKSFQTTASLLPAITPSNRPNVAL